MAEIFQRGIKIVLGVCERRPITGAAVGKTKLRMRNNRAAELFIKTKSGISRYLLEDRGDTWYANPRLLQGANFRRVETKAFLPGANIFKAMRLNPQIVR